jgi:hypothetical protein
MVGADSVPNDRKEHRMTESIPTAELIGERIYGGRPTDRILCVYCGRLHLHSRPADDTTPLAAHCGQGLYTLAQP